MEKPRQSVEEMMHLIHEKNQKLNLYELEIDENGNYLLDPANSYHVEWYENDEDYEVIK
ncbi:hypothetical protein KTG14_17625 [Planococcus sp. CP5-4_YE]|uniref:hypothetical protein n=1 Tax=Planococcus sp. CP5-4_YE TaxID=2850320 RepID=UPI001C21EAFF|nr:hypothetical protein [Planococcus sp. CP5-4_YE]MBU9675199.1 hypothetical protein [Planococcus sp. CP5-4_YE]